MTTRFPLWPWAFAGVSVVLCVEALNSLSPERMHADTTLLAVMSLQHVSVFVWGQDRFANFIPLLLSPVRNPWLNLWGQMFVFGLSYFLLLLAVAWTMVRMSRASQSRAALALAFATLIAASLVILRPDALHVFLFEGQPYGPSYLLLLLAFLWMPERPLGHPFGVALAAGMLLVAMGLNPSIVLAAAALALGQAMLARTWVRPVLLLALAGAAFAAWSLLAHRYALQMETTAVAPYFSFDFGNAASNLPASMASIARQVRPEPVVALLLACGALTARKGAPTSGAVAKAILLLCAFGALWFVTFANNDWIRTNGYSFRYFFPVMFAIVVAVSWLVFAWTGRLSQSRMLLLAATLIAGSAVYLFRPYVPLPDYLAFRKIRPQVALMERDNIRFVAGDYWTVWLLVFRALADGRDALGVTYRADGNAASLERAVDEELRRDGEIKVLCVADTPDACKWNAEHYTGRPWKSTAAACGAKCAILTLSP